MQAKLDLRVSEYTYEVADVAPVPAVPWHPGAEYDFDVMPTSVTVRLVTSPAGSSQPAVSVIGMRVLKNGGHGDIHTVNMETAATWPAWLRLIVNDCMRAHRDAADAATPMIAYANFAS